jgi:mRNA interferase MazF
VSKKTYFPDRGDLVLCNFFPAAGREIEKRRPAIVLSPLAYNKPTGLCVAVPTSTQLKPGPFWVRLPDGLLDEPSMILCDLIKSFDYRERAVVSLEKKVDRDTMDSVVSIVMNLIDPVFTNAVKE